MNEWYVPNKRESRVKYYTYGDLHVFVWKKILPSLLDVNEKPFNTLNILLRIINILFDKDQNG